MNKFFTRIVGAALGLAMAIGVGVTVASRTDLVPLHAAEETYTWNMASGDLGSTSTSSGTAGTKTSGGITWSYNRKLTSGVSYTGWSSSCIQMGKNGGVENVTISTSGFSGTITKVSVECSSYNNAHKVAISVGGTTYLSATATDRWTTIGTKTTGTISASGEIVISFTDGARALYVKSIQVKYNASSTYGVTYDGNGSTSGTVPVDSNEYDSGDSVTVLGNTGSLKKPKMVFNGWNTKQDGTGTARAVSSTFTISSDVTLFAQWAADTVHHIEVDGDVSKTAYTEGQSWDPSGLTVYAYYNDNTTLAVDVTDDPSVTWSYNPAKANDVSVKSFIATATFGGKSADSNSQSVTVTEDNTVKYLLSDELTTSTFGSPDSYGNWSGKTATSDAVYAGNSTTYNSTSIQIRAKENSGIVSTTSGGNVRKVTVDWNDNTSTSRYLQVYGKSTAYSASSDLYSTDNKGTLLGEIEFGVSTSLSISGDYEYVGLLARGGAMYIDEIIVSWEVEAPTSAVTAINAFISTYMHLNYTKSEGYCKDSSNHWYSTAKAAYDAIENTTSKLILATSNSKYGKVDIDADHKNPLDPDSVTYTYADVRERLIKWAHFATGETIDFNELNGNIISLARVSSSFISDNNSKTTILIIVLISSSIIVIGSCFFIRRRKQR